MKKSAWCLGLGHLKKTGFGKGARSGELVVVVGRFIQVGHRIGFLHKDIFYPYKHPDSCFEFCLCYFEFLACWVGGALDLLPDCNVIGDTL